MANALSPITDPDSLMADRDTSLTLASDKHLEASSLHKSKCSSMCTLVELHNQSQDHFVYTCNECKRHMETRYHCTTCEDYDLCIACYNTKGYWHKMEKLGFDLDDESNKQAASAGQNPGDSGSLSIQRCIQSLVHAYQCHNANRSLPSCQKIKRMVQHTKVCQRKAKGDCPICQRLISLCCYHAKHCQENKCPVPFCLNIKHKLRQQQLQHRLKQAPMLRRGMASMQSVGQAPPGRAPGGLPSPEPNGATGPSTPTSVRCLGATPQTLTQGNISTMPQQHGVRVGTPEHQQKQQQLQQPGGAMLSQHHLHPQFSPMGGEAEAAGGIMNTPLVVPQNQHQRHPPGLLLYSTTPTGPSPVQLSLGKPGLGSSTSPLQQQQANLGQGPMPVQSQQHGPPLMAVDRALKIQWLAETQRQIGQAQILQRQGQEGMMAPHPHPQNPQAQMGMTHPGVGMMGAQGMPPKFQRVAGRTMLDPQEPWMLAGMQQVGPQSQLPPQVQQQLQGAGEQLQFTNQQWGASGPGMIGQMTPQQQQALTQQQQQQLLHRQQLKEGPGDAAGDTAAMAAATISGKALHRKALQELLRALHSPSSTLQQLQVLNILRSNPPLMAAIIKQRMAKYERGRGNPGGVGGLLQGNPGGVRFSGTAGGLAPGAGGLGEPERNQMTNMGGQQQVNQCGHPGMNMAQGGAGVGIMPTMVQLQQLQQQQQQWPMLPGNLQQHHQMAALQQQQQQQHHHHHHHYHHHHQHQQGAMELGQQGNIADMAPQVREMLMRRHLQQQQQQQQMGM